MIRRCNGRRGSRIRMRAASPLAIAAVTLAMQAGLHATTATPVAAKTPGSTYCFHGYCHRVKTIEETKKAIGATQVVKASFYYDAGSDRYNPSNVTSSGEYFRSDRPDNAASPNWPDGTRLLIWNPTNKRTAVVRINNAGPYWGGRTLDVSRATADRLGFAHAGVATLHTKVVAAPTPAEAKYAKGRSYSPVPGFLGVFDTIDTALLSVGRAIGGLFTSPTHAAAGRDPSPAQVKGTRTVVAAAQSRAEPAKPEAKAEPVKPAAKPQVVAAKPAPKPEPKAATVVAKAEARKPEPKQPEPKVAAKPVTKVVVAEARPVTQPATKPQPPRAQPAKPEPQRVAQAEQPRPVAMRVPQPTARPVVQQVPQRSSDPTERYTWRATRCSDWPYHCDESSAATREASVRETSRRESSGASSKRQ